MDNSVRLTVMQHRSSIHDINPIENGTSKKFVGDIKSMGEAEPLQNSPPTCTQRLKSWMYRDCCSVSALKRRLPILVWLPKYGLEDLKGDLVAGSTVALTVIPQGLALALLAGLPPQFGLYTAFMGCFMYTVFGSCKDLTIGPTSIMSIMTAHHVAIGGVTYCILLTFLTGCIMLIMGILNLGFLVTFISSSVVTGFTTAAAITIAATQLSGIFGMKYKSENFIEDIINFFHGLISNQIRYWDMAMGLSSIAFLLLLSYFRDVKFERCCCSRAVAKTVASLWWLICTARNAILVLIAAGIAAALIAHGVDALTLTQEVEPGLPSFKLPVFSYNYYDNSTNTTVHVSFLHMVQDLGSGLAVIPLLGVLEAIAIGKSFAKGKKIDATQEMVALGVCNIMGSFVSSYPATGSFSRTAINYNSGVRTPAGGIATGALVLLALGILSPCFHYIPKASLSALIFVAVLNMVHYEDIIVMWKTNKLDLLPFLATLVFSFILGLEYGIVIGIGISLCYLMYQEARPKVLVKNKKTFLGNSYLYVKPDRSVFFPSAEYLQTKIINSLPDMTERNTYAVLLDGRHIMNADFTMAMGCKSMISSFEVLNIRLVFAEFLPTVQQTIIGALSDSEKFVHFLCKDEAETYIDALYIDKMPPAYGAESTESLSAAQCSVDTNDSGLFEK